MILLFPGNADPSLKLVIVNTHQPRNCPVVPYVVQRLRKVTGTAEAFAHPHEEADILTWDLVETKLECYLRDSEIW
jgi:hypothetical protein